MTHTDREVEAPVRDSPATSGDGTSPGKVDLTHAEVRGRLSEYLDGSLSPDVYAHVHQHLDRCPPCRAFLNTLRRVIDAVGQLPPRGLPGQAKRRILDQLKAAAGPG
ncbi:MAG: zf-HC2 domain-containing protein [Chloroflexi bacterium]|nr:zf-HC2 domain-containing protein [Chloroflexota bacterium]